MIGTTKNNIDKYSSILIKNGYEKRNNITESQYYDSIIKKYSSVEV